MNGKEAMAQYRHFRQQLLDGIAESRVRSEWGACLGEPSEGGLAAGRQIITAFRKAVADQAKTQFQTSPDSDRLVRRALRIPPFLPLRPGALTTVGQIALFFLPTPFYAYCARRLLGWSGTFEGRKLLFELFIFSSWPGGQRYYDDALDFALRRFEVIRFQQDFKTLDRMEADLLRVAHRLGLRTPAELREALPLDSRRQKSRLLWLLVSEGVIGKTAELQWAGESSPWSDNGQVDDDQIIALRNTLRCLLDHGVERKRVAGILLFPLWALNPGTLSDNLNFLESACDADLSSTLELLGDRLWRAPAARWRFVVETIGAHSASEIARFKRLLDCDHGLSEELVHELVSFGAKQDDLVGCQRLLAELNPEKEGASPFIDNLRLLAAPPHALSVDQLSQCSAYVRGGGNLAPFLQMLTLHGMGGAQAVIEFQCCFSKVSARSLGRILKILGTRGQGEPLAHVATWALEAGQGENFDAYDYLVEACEMEGLGSLQQASKLVQLGVPFLKYLVETCGLGSLKEIRTWYYKARGIEGYHSRGAYDTLDRVLLDDAFTRNQFNHLAANQAVIQAVVRRRVELRLGARSRWDDEAAENCYQQASEALLPMLRDELIPSLPTILGSTGGVLLPTLFEKDGDGLWRLAEKLSCLEPLLTELINGRGPSRDTLTAQEVDAIALIYRTPADTVRFKWPQIQETESDVRQLLLRPHYPITWHQVRWQLRTELDRSGFVFLLNAARFAQGFRHDAWRDMFTACKHLSPKPLRHDFKPLDVGNMALHLGSLLAVAQDHEGVGQWILEGFEALSRIDKDSLDAYQRLGDLVDFFNVLLPDALDARTEGYIKKLSQEEAAHWAARLGPCDTAEIGHTELHAMLSQTRTKALPLYLNWAKRQYRRYKKDGDTSLKTQSLVALVSKHPAAFFAKSAVHLCTAGNVEMWREKRLFHLVVFDQVGRRLAGMALIYVQDLPELNRSRKSLVIRAINPTEEIMAGHSVASIVESVLDVAVQIAEDNKLGCVAFPALSGSHIMSNRAPIESYLKERYVRPALQRMRLGRDAEHQSLRDAPQTVNTTFYAYEHGQELVESVYVIWRTTGATP